jgi:hypothetical protein
MRANESEIHATQEKNEQLQDALSGQGSEITI